MTAWKILERYTQLDIHSRSMKETAHVTPWVTAILWLCNAVAIQLEKIMRHFGKTIIITFPEKLISSQKYDAQMSVGTH